MKIRLDISTKLNSILELLKQDFSKQFTSDLVKTNDSIIKDIRYYMLNSDFPIARNARDNYSNTFYSNEGDDSDGVSC